VSDDFHYFIVTSLNDNLKKKKIILSDISLVNNFAEKKIFEKEKNITLIDDIWNNPKQIELDYLLIEKLLNIYAAKVGDYLNKFHGLNKTQKYWDILILPWLVYYLSSMLHRWRVVKKALTVSNKKILFYNYKNKKDLKIFTTIDFAKYAESSEMFNYELFRKIIDFLSKENDIRFLNSNDALKHPEKKNLKITEYLKPFFFKIVDKLIIFFSKNNSIYIEKELFNYYSYFKLNLKLKQFPQIFKFLFNYKLDNKFFYKINYNKNKRNSVEFDDNKKIDSEYSFQEFLNKTIQFDIPLCFLEGYNEILKRNKEIKINPKIILSSYAYFHNERFKLWAADRVCSKNTKLYVADHGAGEQLKFNGGFRISEKVVEKRITWAKPRSHKDYQLPALGLRMLKRERKNETYLTYVEHKSIQFANKIGPYKLEFLNIENILILKKNLNNKVFNSLKYIRHEKFFNTEAKEIKKILDKKFINKHLVLKKYIPLSKIVICTYPETGFTESLISGPTILLNDKQPPFLSDSRSDLMDSLLNCKIAFNDTKKACEHINSIWDNPYKWWNSKEVQISIEKFKSEFVFVSKKPIESWYRFFKDEINK